MGINDIVCGVCGSHDFKHINGKPVCQGCGYVLTEEDINNILEASYQEFKKEIEQQ